MTFYFKVIINNKSNRNRKSIWHTDIKTGFIHRFFNDVVLIIILVTLFRRDGLSFFWLADRKSTRLNSSHVRISYAVFCLKNKTTSLSVAFAFYLHDAL